MDSSRFNLFSRSAAVWKVARLRRWVLPGSSLGLTCARAERYPLHEAIRLLTPALVRNRTSNVLGAAMAHPRGLPMITESPLDPLSRPSLADEVSAGKYAREELADYLRTMCEIRE